MTAYMLVSCSCGGDRYHRSQSNHSPVDHQQLWTACVLNLVAQEDAAGDQYVTSDYVPCRTLLGESRTEAMAIAGQFHHIRLDQAAITRLITD